MGLSSSRQSYHGNLELLRDASNQPPNGVAEENNNRLNVRANITNTDENEDFFDSLNSILNGNVLRQTPTNTLSGRDAYLFWINRVVGSAPRIMKTKTVLSKVAINKSSIRLRQRVDVPCIYDVEFMFDATTDCAVSVAYCTEEIRKEGRLQYVDSQSGNLLEVSNFEEISESDCDFEKKKHKEMAHDSSGIDRATFPPNLNQSFSTAGMQGLDTSLYNSSLFCHNSEEEEPSAHREEDDVTAHIPLNEERRKNASEPTVDSEGPEGGNSSSATTSRMTNTDSNLSVGRKNLIPIVIVIESVHLDKEANMLNTSKPKRLTRDTISSQILLLKLIKNNANYDCHVVQQKVFVNGLIYNVHDVYGIEQSLYSTEERVLDSTYTGPDECVICLGECRNTLVLPCRHLCLCEECAETMTYHSTKCPICRGPLQLLLRVEFSDEGRTEKEYKSASTYRATK